MGADADERLPRPEDGPTQFVAALEDRLTAKIDSRVSQVEDRLTSVLTSSFAAIADNQRTQSHQISQLTTALLKEKAQVRDAMRADTQGREEQGLRLERLVKHRDFNATRGGRTKAAPSATRSADRGEPEAQEPMPQVHGRPAEGWPTTTRNEEKCKGTGTYR